MRKLLLLFLIVVATIIVVIMVGEVYFHPKGYRFILPEKYAGWVCVYHGVRDAPPLLEQDGFLVIEIPLDGVLKTSSTGPSGKMHDEFYYRTSSGVRRAEEIEFGGGGTLQRPGLEGITYFFWLSHDGLAKAHYQAFVERRDLNTDPPCGPFARTPVNNSLEPISAR